MIQSVVQLWSGPHCRVDTFMVILLKITVFFFILSQMLFVNLGPTLPKVVNKFKKMSHCFLPSLK